MIDVTHQLQLLVNNSQLTVPHNLEKKQGFFNCRRKKGKLGLLIRFSYRGTERETLYDMADRDFVLPRDTGL